MPKILSAFAVILVMLIASSCQTRHEVELKPVEIKPIHITVDVNVRVQKSLNDLLDEIEE